MNTKNDSLTNVSPELFNDVFQEVIKNPLQGLFLTHCSKEEIMEMDTKFVLIRNKAGEIKLAGMAIKDYETEAENGEYVKVENETGGYVKEATALFSVNIDDLDEELRNSVLDNLDSLVIEPEDYGKKGEPNLVLSLLQQGILDNIEGEIRGSHFGEFLSSQYEKMGKEITNGEGYDFAYEFLSPGAQESYIEYVKIQMGKMKEYKGIPANLIKYDAELNKISVKGVELPLKEVKRIIEEINSKIRYYETVVNKDSVEFKVHGTKTKKTIESSLINFEEGQVLRQFLETLESKDGEVLSFQEIMKKHESHITKKEHGIVFKK